MFRGAAAWLVGGASGLAKSTSTSSLNALDEPQAHSGASFERFVLGFIFRIEESTANTVSGGEAMAQLMDDDVKGAEATLEDGNSSFHKLAQGVIAFLRASLGFEPDIMREASERLADAEASADRDRKKAQREPHRHTTYPPGTEFALCHAEAQLMSAVVGVLSESIVDAMKAFYKLRRAYQMLEEIQATKPILRAPGSSAGPKENEKKKNTRDADRDSIDTKSMRSAPSRPATRAGRDQDNVSISASEKERVKNRRASFVSTINMDIMEPMDVFIHSGSNLCFGLLLVILSLIPPSLGRLLSIIGFRGDRTKGLDMLWKAAKADNVHGAIATLALLNFYGNALQFCDILPEDDGELGIGYPKQKCYDALVTMRQRYPRSALWLLEEARMEAVNGHLENAIDLLNIPAQPQMRQVEALMVFEKALNSMFLHRHQDVADSFLKVWKLPLGRHEYEEPRTDVVAQLSDLNNWSHALYHYFAAVSYVEMYRETVESNPSKAQEYAKKAEILLERTPTFMGKKRFMAQSLPLEVFADRKIKKWQARAKERNVRLIEGVGVSPVEEMMYFWNGYKRMNNDDFAKSLIALEWKKEELKDDVIDERAIHSLLTSVVLRNMGEMDKAKEHLQDVLNIDKFQLKGNLKDDWTAPTAHYEWAVVLWQEHGPKEVAEAKVWLQKAARWEAYELDTRVGLRVTTALDTVNRYLAEDGTAAAAAV